MDISCSRSCRASLAGLVAVVIGMALCGHANAAGWGLTGDMNTARVLHSATLLADGRVLVAGGRGSSALDSAELYDPISGNWTATGKMLTARMGHTATLLPDGRVLVVGGITGASSVGSSPYLLDEIYDPHSGAWVAAGPLRSTDESYRYGHRATPLPSGGVLVTGGWSWNEDTHADSLLYHPPTASPEVIYGPKGFAQHQATLLRDGRVLVTGGWRFASPAWVADADALVLDPVERTWIPMSPLAHARVDHTATLLSDGTVLVVGGGSVDSELFDPTLGAWRAGASSADRSRHTASLLRDGRVLVVGGAMQRTASATTELYDPSEKHWEAGPWLEDARMDHTATVLADGRVLIAGGISSINRSLASAEIFAYRQPTLAATVVEYRDTQDFPGSPGGHYFYTDDPDERAIVDTGGAGRFIRTGSEFKSGGSKRVCRFFGSLTPGPRSHFYTASDAECAALKTQQLTPVPVDVQQWNFEGLWFGVEPVLIDEAGAHCPAGTLPVYRGYNNAYPATGQKNSWDSVHRYSTRRDEIDSLVAMHGWRDEGIAFCSPE